MEVMSVKYPTEGDLAFFATSNTADGPLTSSNGLDTRRGGDEHLPTQEVY